MLFTSGKYWIFLILVFFLYWSIAHRRRLAVGFILVASYYFYALWNPKFVFLLFGLSTIDFLTARAISLSERPGLRRLFLFVSITTDVGSLITFKYFNFFSASANSLFEHLHLQTRSFLIEDLVIPLGLSFITFRSLSYVIDVYRRTTPATNQYIHYLAFVAFFPTLIAGPVVRAQQLLPQFERAQLSDAQGHEAILLILIGLIKKVAIADLLAANLVDRVFDQPQLYSSVETLAAIYGYAVQIYYDFSGYTDIAIGSALLLGFQLPPNFNAPYRAQNLRDFWKRWHITLSTWLFDYVYISIGGLRKHRFNLHRNLLITFLVGGLWHGAAWTFVVWGGLHGLGLCLSHWWLSVKKKNGLQLRNRWWTKAVAIICTFHFVCLTWIVFRSETISQATEILRRLGSFEFSTNNLPTSLILVIVLPLLTHFLPSRTLTTLTKGWAWLPSPAQALLILSIGLGLYYVSGTEVQFIYGNF